MIASRLFLTVPALLVLSSNLAFCTDTATNDIFIVQAFGARGDGKTDDTQAFQNALDTAGKAGGGVVYAGRGNYLFRGHLTEWRLDKTQNFLTQRFALARSGTVNEENAS
jgi:hypothetical protein